MINNILERIKFAMSEFWELIRLGILIEKRPVKPFKYLKSSKPKGLFMPDGTEFTGGTTTPKATIVSRYDADLDQYIVESIIEHTGDKEG